MNTETSTTLINQAPKTEASLAIPGKKKLISVVIPAFNEEAVVDELTRQLQQVFSECSRYDFEVIIVENGSADTTYDRLLAIHEKDKRFKILQLSRNFRCDGGITAGLQFARGDAAVIMNADLQDPPELIPKFLEQWEAGYENVYGIVTKRNGTSWLRRANSQVFYWLLGLLTNNQFPRNASDFRLVDRKLYQTINDMAERNRFMRGMFIWAGFKSTGVPHERAERFAGEAKSYSLQVVELAIKGLFAYSYKPLKIIMLFGLAVSGLAFTMLGYEVYKAIYYGVPFNGFGTIMGVILLMFGFLFIMLGVISEYIGLIYEEVKQRPNFIVKSKLGL